MRLSASKWGWRSSCITTILQTTEIHLLEENGCCGGWTHYSPLSFLFSPNPVLPRIQESPNLFLGTLVFNYIL